MWRKGQTRDLPITIAEMQPDKVAKAEQKKPPAPKERASNSLGMAVSDIPADQKKALKLTNGVLVDAVEGPAARAGFQKGDIILRIGDTDITSAKQFEAVAQNVDPGKMVARARASRRQHAVRAVAPARAGAEISGGDGIVHALRARVVPSVR